MQRQFIALCVNKFSLSTEIYIKNAAQVYIICRNKKIVTVGKQNYHVITIEIGRNIAISKYSINAVLIRKAR